MNQFNSEMFEGFIETPTETQAVVVRHIQLPSKPKNTFLKSEKAPLAKPKFKPRPLSVKLFDVVKHNASLRRPIDEAVQDSDLISK